MNCKNVIDLNNNIKNIKTYIKFFKNKLYIIATMSFAHKNYLNFKNYFDKKIMYD